MDQSESNSVATATNVTFANGLIGNSDGSVQFPGISSGQITIENNGKLDTTYSLTVVVNLYLDQTGPILNWGNNEIGVGFFYEKPKLSFRLQERDSGFAFQETVETANLNEETWYYVAVTYDYNDGLAKMYVGK